jgi:hypothetical protein
VRIALASTMAASDMTASPLMAYNIQ